VPVHRQSFHSGRAKGFHGIHEEVSRAGTATVVEAFPKGVMPVAAEVLPRFSFETAADTSDCRIDQASSLPQGRNRGLEYEIQESGFRPRSGLTKQTR
jgi:hypothetical protein